MNFYKTNVQAVGPEVESLLEGGVLVLYQNGAPPELAEVSVLHEVESISDETPSVGSLLKIGSIEVGKKADMILIGENPLKNLKVLYGTGAIKLTEDNDIIRVGGVKYTIKDGVIYDAKALLDDVRKMADEAKAEEDFKINQPGMDAFFRRLEDNN